MLFGLPNAATQSNDFEIAIPKLASIYLTHKVDGEIKGIDAFADRHPPVARCSSRSASWLALAC